jgi:phage tail sheath gpL-like
MSSNAVTLDRISRIVGYKITKGTFNVSSPNLPQRIALLAEANDAYQSVLSTLPQQITSAQQAAILFGDGSPIHIIARILFPNSGDGLGGVPVYVYPQARATGAAAKLMKITPVGVATANVTHYVKIAGRDNIDGTYYALNILSGDNAAQVAQKIEDAVNAVYGAPVQADADAYETILTSKWKGLTANDLNVSVDTGTNAAGLTYTVTYPQAGSGTPSIAGALAQFGSDWNTIVVNSYGLEATTIATLMAYNGIPDPTSPTGRYSGLIMKPFIAISGSVSDDPSATTNLYLNDVTIAVAPAPGSAGLPMEAAANMSLLFGVQAQNSPQLDVAGQFYPDMPVPTAAAWAAASMSSYTNRDAIVKRGCSTVTLNAGRFKVQDFVTTYHPLGEVPPQFRYCRNLNIDFNVRYGYYLLELVNVVDHAIVADEDLVTADGIVKPKMWKSVLSDYAEDLAKRALITSPAFTQDSITVNVGTTNPDRLETFFRYKRSSFARIASTTAEAGFNFGTL